METEILIIGGGITGLGIARDAAMRGFKVILVERGELGNGTSGYFHGILHSGARYAVVDPESAKECYAESQILRKIIPSAILDTGGLFLALDDDEVNFADKVRNGCKNSGIPSEEISPQKVWEKEPKITKNLKRAFTVPDGHIDGPKTLSLHEKTAVGLGVQIITSTEVTGFVQKKGRIEVVMTRDKSGREKTISAQFIINSAGVWASKIGGLAGITINLVGDKGSLIVFKNRFSTTLLNRCRIPSDGDQLLPTFEEYIIGTTSIKTKDIDTHKVEQWEIDKLVQEAERMVPSISQSRIIRTYAGVRPVYNASSESTNGRLDKRSFEIIDHQKDGISNLISVVGGKFVLYRLMAERAVDAMCDNLGARKNCETARVPL